MKNIGDKLKKDSDDLKSGLENMAMDDDAQFDTYIEKVINKRIRKIAAKTCIIILASIVAVIFCINPVVSLFFPNAEKLNERDGENPSQLLKLMRAYYETVYPDKEVTMLEVEKDGFGCYTIQTVVMDHSGVTTRGIGGAPTVEMAMKWGRLSVESDPQNLATFILGKFYNGTVYVQPEDVIADLEKLPETAYIYVNVSQNQASDVDDVMVKAGKMLDWIQVYQPESNFQAGVRLAVGAACEEGDAERPNMSSEEIKEIYLSNLKLLQENYDLWKDLGLYSNSTLHYVQTDTIQNLIDAAEKDDSFRTKNYCIYGSKEDVLEYLKTTDCVYLWVENVQYSAFG